METQHQEMKETSAEAFLFHLSEEIMNEKEKLAYIDGNKEVSKTEYKKIQEQAKLVAFLSEMEKAAMFYSEASENKNIELLAVIKRYLNI